MSWEVWTMKSRALSCKLTLLKKDITRFAPVWALYTVFLLVTMSGFARGSVYDRLQGMENFVIVLLWVNLFYGEICAQMLFGDLFSTRLCAGLHALPVKRETWFGVHLTAGMLFSLVPNALMCVIFMCFGGSYWYWGLWSLGIVTLQFIFFFGSAVLCAVCSGSRFAALVLYGMVQFLYPVLWGLVEYIYQPLLYGVDLQMWPYLCPMLGMTNDSYMIIDAVHYGKGVGEVIRGVQMGPSCLIVCIYALVGAGMLLGALAVYRRRRLENAGEFLAVEGIKPVFAVAFTLCAAMVAGLFGALFGLNSAGAAEVYCFLTVGVVVGWFVAQALLKRSLRVFSRRNFGMLAALLIFVLGSLWLTEMDPLGITRRVPQTETVTVEIDGRKAEIDGATARKLHTKILDQGEDAGSGVVVRIRLEYPLPGGGKLARSYLVHVKSPAGQFAKELSGTPQMVLGNGWENRRKFLSQVAAVYVNGQQMERETVDSLLDALLADCEAGTMAGGWYFREDDMEIAYVEISIAEGSSGIRRYSVNYIPIYADCVNTVRWLEENEVESLYPDYFVK